MAQKKLGKQSVAFTMPPRVISSAAAGGPMECDGPIGGFLDIRLEDDTLGEDSYEKAERLMLENTVRKALDKISLASRDVDCLLGGDLLNQIISANFAARELKMPFLGLYGACSTMAESLLIGSMMTDGGFLDVAACTACSHFSTAERQYRLPLEMGSQPTPTSQRTVTGAGCCLIGSSAYKGQRQYTSIAVTGGTIGRVVDLGISDISNMGAAMAPAAADTLEMHLSDTGRDISYYDLVITGDLGSFGADMMRELCSQKGIFLGDKHIDCGEAVFLPSQDVQCGGSGCGCSAITLSAYLLDRMEAGDFNKAFFMATGALMSPTSGMQKDTIPGIAHGVAIERMA